MRAAAAAAGLVLVAACGHDQPACPARAPALAPVCTAPGFCWAVPTPSPLGTLMAVSPAGCDYLIAAADSPPKPIYTLGTADTLATLPDPGVGLPYTGLLAFSPTDVWAITDVSALPDDQSFALHFDGTQWQSFPFAQGPLGAIWGTSPTDVWIAFQGDYRIPVPPALEHWDGHALASVDVPASIIPTAGLARARDDLWLCGVTVQGYSPVTAHYDGHAWQTYPPNVAYCGALEEVGGQLFLVGGQSVMKWGGGAWSAVYTEPDTMVSLSSLWGASAGDLWVGGSRQVDPGIDNVPHYASYLAHDVSGHWAPVTVGGTGVSSIRGTDAGDVLFVGRNEIAHWDGKAVTELASEPIDPQGWMALKAFGDTVWAVDASGEGVSSTGGAWTRSHPCYRDCGSWVRLAGSGPSDVWLLQDAMGNGFSYSHFDGSAWTWNQIQVTPAPGPGSFLVDIFVASPTDVWALGFNAAAGAVLLHFDGTSWTSEAGPSLSSSNGLGGVWASGGDVWVTDGSALYRRQGGQWLAIDTSSVGQVGGEIFGRSSNDLYFGGDMGLVHWDGAAFHRIDTHPIVSVDGDAVRLWVTGLAGYLALDDGTGLRQLDTGAQVDLVGASFSAPSGQIDRGWVAGRHTGFVGQGVFLEYRP